MNYIKHVVISVLVLLLIVPTSAAAQRSSGWKIARYKDYVSAGGCNSDGNCVELRCQLQVRDSFVWQISAPYNRSTDQESRVTWHLDGGLITFPMHKNSYVENGRQGYDGYFSPDNPYSSKAGPTLAQSQALLQALRRESFITVDGELFPTFNLSLRGSNAALTKLLAQCPFVGEVDEAAVKAALLGWDAPFEAVEALAAKQGCIISESEIHDAMMQAGSDIWSFNQFVVNGSQNGTLEPLGEKDGEYRYRLAGCVSQ